MEEVEYLLNIVTHLGWLAVVAVIFAESGMMIGFFMPGDSLLFTAGFLVQQQVLPINIHAFVFILFLAAVLGNSCGYLIGRKFGRRLFEHRSRLFKKKYLHDAERFYEKYGPGAIVLAMFVPIVRAFAPVVAGVAKMEYHRFIAFNIVGAGLWVSIMTYLGYFGGAGLKEAGFNIEFIAIIIIAISLMPALIHAIQNPHTRAKFKNKFRALLRR